MKIPDENFQGIIEPNDEVSAADPLLEISQALENPANSKRLASSLSLGERVAVVIDDVTRPSPTNILIGPLVTRLTDLGARAEDITLIIATGMHRPATSEEITRLIGAELAGKIRTVNHDCRAEDLTYLGDTAYGTKVYVNKEFATADIKILTGDVELHYFAGYGGGRKSVLPGISGAQTTMHNHSLMLHPKARPGVLEGNPVSEDMTQAAEMAKVDFILNVVLNRKREIVKAFSGNLHGAFMNGVQLVDKISKVPCEAKADIAVVSAGGKPRDVSLYQALKAVHHTMGIVKDGGAIVLIAECPEGHGNDTFREWMIKFSDLRRMEREIKRRFAIGGHKAYLMTKALERVKIYLVSAIPDYYVSNVFRLRPSRTANAALQAALRAVGKDSKVVAVTHGATTLPMLRSREDAP